MTEATGTIDRPAHVPPGLLYDFDISYDPLLKSNLHLGLIELGRRTPEIFYTPRYGGHWVARSLEAIFEISQNPEIFSNDLTKISDNRIMLPIFADPPEHFTYRRVLLSAFSPKTVNALQPMIRSFAAELLDTVVARGECDFAKEVAEILPVTVFMRMLGIPLHLREPLRVLILRSLLVGHPDDRDRIFGEMEKLIASVIEARIARREDDIISTVLDADIDGRKATLEETMGYVLFLATAGLDTVTNSMSFTARHLALNPQLQRQLREDPKLLPEFLEELLRRYGISSVLRYVTKDTVFRGVEFKQGERVHVLIPAGNLDETAFEDPAQIVLGRKEPSITFGLGVHRCLGSHLARLELRVLFEEVLARLPEFTADPGEIVESAGMTYAVDHLPLRWHVQAEAAAA